MEAVWPFPYRSSPLPEGAGQFKIGVAKSPRDRLGQLQTGCPFDLELRVIFPCRDVNESSRLEYLVKEHFNEDRGMCREWVEASLGEILLIPCLATRARHVTS